MKYMIGVDASTTATKALLVARDPRCTGDRPRAVSTGVRGSRDHRGDLGRDRPGDRSLGGNPGGGRRRRGDNKAIVAVANTILAVVWHLLTTGETYHDLEADHFQTRDRDSHARHLTRRLEALGYQVTLEDTAA